MTKTSRPELFAQRPVRSDFGRSPRGGGGPRLRIGRFIVLLAALALVGGVIWGVSFYMSDDEVPDGTLPQVEAELPLKEKPDQPGGIDIPHQDIQVFQQLNNKAPTNGAVSEVEHLLPAPETPQASSVPQKEEAPAPNNVAKVEEELPPAITEVEPLPTQPVQTAPEPQLAPVPAAAADKTVKAAPEPATVPVPEAVKPVEAIKKQEPASKKVTTPKTSDKVDQALARLPKELFTTGTVPTSSATTAEPKAAASGGKTVRVQLASFPEETAAQQALGRYQSQYGAAVGTSLSVVRASIPGKGAVYRIMSDPLSDAQAKSACAALAQKSAACIVVR